MIRSPNEMATFFSATVRLGVNYRWQQILLATWMVISVAALRAAERPWTKESFGRQTPLLPAGSGSPGFRTISANSSGFAFTNLLSLDRSLANHILMNGSGVACGDVNGDGLCDVYLCGLDGDNALFQNLGNWQFTNITTTAGVACSGYDCTGCSLVDLDGDGDLDLLIATIGRGVLCFNNDGTGRFREVTTESGLASQSGAMGFALADADGDGDLDLYVVNYRSQTLRDTFNVRLKVGMIDGHRGIVSVNGRPTTEPDLIGRFTLLEGGGFVENGEADQFYRNDGKGHFELVPFTGGAFRDEHDQPLKEPPYDWGLSVLFRDFNGDGWPDLYVCNDLQSPDRIWINRGDGSFRAASGTSIRETSWFSMGVDVADLNRDGWDDLFVADMLSRDHIHRHTQDNATRFSPRTFGAIDQRLQVPRSTLLVGRGGTEWAELGWFAGLAATDWSWSPVFLDVDLDGYEDLLITTGFERDVQDMDVAMQLDAIRQQRKLSDRESLQLRKQFPPLFQPNLAFRNRGDLTFEEVGERWGFHWTGVSQGIALADLDQDGDLDVVVNNLNGPALLLENTAPAARVAVRLHGQGSNSAGIGARIRLTAPGLVQEQEMVRAGRYLSSDDALRTFACHITNAPMALEVRWRSGARSHIEGIRSGWLIEIDESSATPVTRSETNSIAKTLFRDTTATLSHQHFETPYDDFERQPLLSRRLSQLGPGVVWFDLDGDGWEDLWIGTGRGGSPGAFLNDRKGGFQALTCPRLANTPDDIVTTLGFRISDGSPRLVVGMADYELGAPEGPAGFVVQPSVRDGALQIDSMTRLPAFTDSSGAMAMADINGDGHLDLLVGGRVIPGKYPSPASSRIFLGTERGFELDPTNSATLKEIGLVTAAIFTDLNEDGRPDLVITTEWGAIRAFLNRDGLLADATESLGLNRWKGWWNGISAGDFNGDGKMDLIASNWGRNHRAAQSGCTVFFGDLDENGTFDLLEGYPGPTPGSFLPWVTLDRLGEALPFLRSRFHSYGEYARADIATILGPEGKAASRLSVDTFESMLFLNQSGRFLGTPLPSEAQWTAGFAPVVADFDGDGLVDLFLSQNFLETEQHVDRLDAGLGLLMLGNGKGSFSVLPPAQSGMRIYGSQRGAAAADYDHDGRMDLVVTQNSAPTRLFHNETARPGLRVSLRLQSRGRDAIGAVVRPVYATGALGPATELRLGDSYWSQGSSTLVIADREPVSALWVRWPGGTTTTTKIPAGLREIILEDSGLLRSVEQPRHP